MYKNDNNETDAKKKLSLVISIFAILLLVIVVIINKDPLKSFASIILSILEPILLGAAIAYVLNPLLRFFEFKVFKKIKNKNIVRAIALIITYVIAIFVLLLTIWVIFPKFTESIVDIGKNYNVYARNITDFVNKVISEFTSESEFFDPDQLMVLVAEVLSDSEDLFDSLANNLLDLGMRVFTIAKNVLLALFISIYMLIGKERIYAKTIKALKAFLSDKAFTTVMRYARKANSTFGMFFVGKLLDSVIVSLIALIFLLSFGFPYALLIALIVGAFNLIPYLGIFIGIIISSIIVLIACPSKFLVFFLLMIIIQQIDSNVIAPRILSRRTGMSSLWVIVAVVIMGDFFGVIGMIVAVPIFAILFTILKEFTETRLAKKGLKTSTRAYYSDPAFSIESKPRRTVLKALSDLIKKIFKSKRNSNK